MGDNAIRAIIIGVAVFLVIITITSIVLYYNTAVEQARALNERQDYGTVYDKTVQQLKDDGTVLTGMELRNIVRELAGEYKKVFVGTDTIVKDIYGNIPDNQLSMILLDSNYKIDSFTINEGTDTITLTLTT